MISFNKNEQAIMRHALRLAQAAANADEAPVGAVIYDDSGIVGEGENRIRRDNDTTAHAEIVALRDACRRLGNYRLPHCRMAVTLEPCAMCAGAIFLARLQSLIFATPDDKTGAMGSVESLHANAKLNHHTHVIGGLYAHEAAALLHNFFSVRR